MLKLFVHLHKLVDCINLTANLGLRYGISDYLSHSHLSFST